ncbi:MAG: class I SAM-dependent methyltransferase [Spirochaetales bacterium]|nr:class I SAM-dependent methyltransferase [Spirochaetales bacterium]
MNKSGNYSGYDLMMVPLEKLILEKYRSRLVTRARGDVLEIGAGSGVNFAYYNKQRIRSLTVTDLDPDPVLRRKMKKYGFNNPVAAEIDALPFSDNSFDTVVMTLVLCSVPDPQKAVREIQRVLRPGGEFIFIEHVASCSRKVKGLQHAVTPAWKRISGNCHLDRDSVKTIQDQGFHLDKYMQSTLCLIAGGVGKMVSLR